MVKFADDAKVYKEMRCQDDGVASQQDIQSTFFRLAFNEKKCKLQSIIRKYKPISSSYEFNVRTIQSCVEERDLRVLVDCNLTWRTEVCHQAVRTNKLLGYIRRNIR